MVRIQQFINLNMAQQFILKRGGLTTTIDSKIIDLEYQLEFTAGSSPRDILTERVNQIGVSWVTKTLDKTTLVNPAKPVEAKEKMWRVSLAGKDGDCEPSLTNLAKEIFLAMAVLFEGDAELKINRVVISYEDEYNVCTKDSIVPPEPHQWFATHYDSVKEYAKVIGFTEIKE